MILFLEQKLDTFRQCFQRNATYEWFVIIVMGFFTRTDKLGVTSFIRSLSFWRNTTKKFFIFPFFRVFYFGSLKDLDQRSERFWSALRCLTKEFCSLVDGTKLSKEGRLCPV